MQYAAVFDAYSPWGTCCSQLNFWPRDSAECEGLAPCSTPYYAVRSIVGTYPTNGHGSIWFAVE